MREIVVLGLPLLRMKSLESYKKQSIRECWRRRTPRLKLEIESGAITNK